MNYMVLYRGGACGTWLTWLINQHKDFPKFEKRDNIRKNINISKDMSCLGADWHVDDISVYDGSKNVKRKSMNWYQFLEYSLRHTVNLDFKHLAYKLIPNHSATTTGNKIDSELLHAIASQVTSKIVLCEVSEVFNDEISKRWNILRKEKEDVRYIRKTLRTDSRTNFNISDYAPYALDVYKADVGKLILGDSEEYNNLCKYIEQEPLSNFKELADDYRTRYFT